MASIVHRSAALLCSYLLGLSQLASAQTAQPLPNHNSSSTLQNVDLSSTQKDQSSGIQPGHTVLVHTAQTTLSVGANDLVTSAERLAIQQILSSGNQTLQLSAAGNAVGGNIQLQANNQQALQNLIIPSGVTVLRDFSNYSTLNIAGTLNNAGNLYAFSTNAASTNAVITAAQIINQPGAVISSISPAALLGIHTNLNLGLTLQATQNIVNSGTISSAGALDLVATGSIINQANSPGSTPIMQAIGDINLLAANVINTGLISSATANVNLASQVLSTLSINNAGGTLEALSGLININSPLMSPGTSLNITGGDFLSRQLNIEAGKGSVELNVGRLSGILNLKAAEAHVQADTTNLQFGNVELSGDPTFISTGNLTLPAATASQPYIAVAGGDILVTPGFSLDTSSNTADGGSVFLIAGANGTLSNGLVVITGRSATGGDVNLTGISSINTSSTLASNQGGDVTFLAFSNAPGSSQGGHIIVPSNVTIQTGVANSGGGGNLLAVAEASRTVGNPNSISIGSFNGNSASAGASRINILTISPDITPAKPLVIVAATAEKSAGAIADGPLQSGSVVSGNLTAPGGLVKILSGGSINTGAISANSSSFGGQIIFLSGGTPGALPVGISTGSINSSGETQATGAVALVTPGSISTGSISTGGASVLLLAGDSTRAGDISFGNIDSSGSSGGNVEISSLGTSGSIGSPTSSIITNASANSGVAGAVTISSANGPISLSSISAQATSTTGNGTAGSVFLSSGNAPAIAGTNTITLSGSTTINTSNASAAGTVGQIYVSYNGANAGTNVNAANSKQSLAAGLRPATPAIARQDAYALSSNQVITLTPGSGGAAAGISGYSAGGFSNVNDSSGALTLTIDTNGDSSVIVPISSSTGVFTVNNAASKIIAANKLGASNVSLLAQGGFSINASLQTSPNLSSAFPVAFLSSTNSDISISNNAVNQAISFGAAASTAQITINNNGNMTFNNYLVAGLDINLSSTGSNGTITLPPNVIGVNAKISANGSGAITGPDSLVTVGNAILSSGSGDIGTLNLNVNQFSANTSGDVKILGQRSLVSLTSSGKKFEVEVHNRNGTLTVIGGGITASSELNLETKKNGDIIFLANISSPTVSVSANGSGNISQTGAVDIGGNSVSLTSGSGSIGKSANPIKTSSASIAANTSGDVFIQASAAQIGLMQSTGANFNVQATSGKIDILQDVKTTGLLTLQAKTGINAVAFVAQTIPVAINPTGIAVSPDASVVFVANTNSNTVSEISTANNQVINTIAVGNSPTGVAISPDGQLVYVANSGSNSVSEISTKSASVIRTIAVPGTPTGVTFNSSGSLAFVSSSSNDTVSFIDTASGLVSGAPISVQSKPGAVAFLNSNSLLYVGNQNSNSISIINPLTRSVTNVALAFSPVGFGACPCGTKLYIADGVAGAHAFSSELNSVVANIALPAGSNPVGIGVNPTGSLVYISNAGDGTVWTIDTLTNTKSSSTNVGGSPQAFGGFATFVGSHATAYVSNATSNSVSVVQTPVLTAPNYNLSSLAGMINVSVYQGIVHADNSGPVVVTSATKIVSSGGTGTGFQLASPTDVQVNGPITATGIIDLHAINGTFSNNSTISTTGGLFFIASSNIVNSGSMLENNASGALALQAPNGVLSVKLTESGSFTSTLDFALNPAGGTQSTLSALPGSSISANKIKIFGDASNHTVDIRVSQINGSINILNNPISTFIQNSQGNLTLGTLSLQQNGARSSTLTVNALNGDLILGKINSDYAGSSQNSSTISLYSSANILFNDFTSAKGIGGAAGGTINVQAPQGSISLAATASSAFDSSGSSGGNIFILARTLQINSTNVGGSSFQANGSSASGGHIQIYSTATPALTIGQSGGVNNIAGGINSNGVSGGTVKIFSQGLNITATGVISADGAAGSGGLIGIYGSLPLTVNNNGSITASNATNNSGAVGFNSAPQSNVIINGTGSIHGGGFVSLGNLQDSNLLPLSPVYFAPTQILSQGGISLSQGSAVGNVIIVGLPTPPRASAPVQTTDVPKLTPISFSLPEIPVNGLTQTDKIRISFTTNVSNDSKYSLESRVLSTLAQLRSASSLSNEHNNQIYRTGQNNIELLSGRILLTPDEDMIVNTSVGSISIKAGAVVLLNVSNGSLAVYDLIDTRLGHVKVSSANTSTIMAPGSVLYLSKNKAATIKSLNQEAFPLRNVMRSETGALVAHSAEFSIASAISKIDILRKAFLSNSATDKQLLNKICKGAAVLSLLQRSHGAYKSAD